MDVRRIMLARVEVEPVWSEAEKFWHADLWRKSAGRHLARGRFTTAYLGKGEVSRA